MSLALNKNVVNTINESEWTLKSKWHHLLFWSLYFIFWIIVSWTDSILDNIIFNVVFLVFNVFAVYTVLYYLMPKYLYTQRYVIFIFFTLCTILLSSSLLGFSLYMVHYLREIPRGDFFNFPLILGPTLGSITTSVVCFMIAKLVKNIVISERKNKTLEHEKTENELKFLKSQLNPHFLFNALNNIYFLIKKDPDIAAESLAKFSDMMRYQLYECNEDKIQLSQEIDYINNYIKITSLGKTETTAINVDILDETNKQEISPLILAPLVENAFKHVSENEEGNNFIDISIYFSGKQLICKTINSYDKHKKNNSNVVNENQGGLGLDNLTRRLSLLYPNNHQLEITESEGEYSSNLKLQL